MGKHGINLQWTWSSAQMCYNANSFKALALGREDTHSLQQLCKEANMASTFLPLTAQQDDASRIQTRIFTTVGVFCPSFISPSSCITCYIHFTL